MHLTVEQLRLAVFLGVFLAVGVAEGLWPRRPRAMTRLRRWPGNLLLIVVARVVVRLAVPVTAVAAAAWSAEQGWGLLSRLGMPGWAAFMLGVVLLDGLVYAQHVVFHRVPWLWRLHRVHHADRDLDVTSGSRFHPLEIVLSTLIKIAAVTVLAPPPESVIAFEIVLNATALFNHGNLRLPAALDRALRLVVVTPDMHRVHHSVVAPETNSNFGFNLPWWDRWFGTYRAQPQAGHAGMTIGLPDEQTSPSHRLDWMLVSPFRRRSPSRPTANGQWPMA